MSISKSIAQGNTQAVAERVGDKLSLADFGPSAQMSELTSMLMALLPDYMRYKLAIDGISGETDENTIKAYKEALNKQVKSYLAVTDAGTKYLNQAVILLASDSKYRNTPEFGGGMKGAIRLAKVIENMENLESLRQDIGASRSQSVSEIDPAVKAAFKKRRATLGKMSAGI